MSVEQMSDRPRPVSAAWRIRLHRTRGRRRQRSRRRVLRRALGIGRRPRRDHTRHREEVPGGRTRLGPHREKHLEPLRNPRAVPVPQRRRLGPRRVHEAHRPVSEVLPRPRAVRPQDRTSQARRAQQQTAVRIASDRDPCAAAGMLTPSHRPSRGRQRPERKPHAGRDQRFRGGDHSDEWRACDFSRSHPPALRCTRTPRDPAA